MNSKLLSGLLAPDSKRGQRVNAQAVALIRDALNKHLGKEDHVRLVASAEIPTTKPKRFYAKWFSKGPKHRVNADMTKELQQLGIELMDLTGRVKKVVPLMEGLYLVSAYESTCIDDVGPYWFLVIVPILSHEYKKPVTYANPLCNVAVSSQLPVKGKPYPCTIIKFNIPQRASVCSTSVDFSGPVESCAANVKLITNVQGHGMTSNTLLVVLS